MTKSFASERVVVPDVPVIKTEDVDGAGNKSVSL